MSSGSNGQAVELLGRMNLIDRIVNTVAPRIALKRVRARLAIDMLGYATQYDGAARTRRTSGWRSSSGDANTATYGSLARLRYVARDLVRNNPNAESALQIISDDTVGRGMRPTEENELWKDWASNPAFIDVDGVNDFAGIQALVMRTIVESGECLIRRRVRRTNQALPIPIQIQVMEPDFLDTMKDGAVPGGTGKIIQGIEFNGTGRRVAYWMFREHPGGSRNVRTGQSVRVPASEIAHIYEAKRAGQVRGASWFAPVLLRFRDFDDYEDATLMKNKIAACLAVITSDIDGTAAPLGVALDGSGEPDPDGVVDLLEPGMILNIPPGRSMEIVNPPQVREYADYSRSSLRQIAAGIGVTYEDLTGDYTDLPFSAARMSRLRHWARIGRWRWRMLQPQCLNPVWSWAMNAIELSGGQASGPTLWTASPLPMIEPDKEGLAIQRLTRNGLQTPSENIRQRTGLTFDQFLAEWDRDFAELDSRGIILDCDPRQMTQAGQLQGSAAANGGEGDGGGAAE